MPQRSGKKKIFCQRSHLNVQWCHLCCLQQDQMNQVHREEAIMRFVFVGACLPRRVCEGISLSCSVQVICDKPKSAEGERFHLKGPKMQPITPKA